MQVERGHLVGTDCCPDFAHQPPDLRGVGITGGIRQTELHRAGFRCLFGEASDIVFVHRAFHRAAKGGGQTHRKVDVSCLCDLGNSADFADHFRM